MGQTFFARLADRGLIRLSGEETQPFLQNLVTCDMDAVAAAGSGFGALLTPQGKIQFDFLIIKTGDGYLLDAPAAVLADLIKRLTFYRLRAKVVIEDASGDQDVFAVWGGAIEPAGGVLGLQDPRLPALGQRLYGAAPDVMAVLSDAGAQGAGADGYAQHRIGLGVPESLSDFEMSDIFPHDAMMDELNGVSFSKGCYVGQEVVSRVHHRGTARKRFVSVTSDAHLPAFGSKIDVDGKTIGTLGSSAQSGDGSKGLALVRLDKAAAALEKGAPIICGDRDVRLELPAWVTFGWPEKEAASD